MADSLYRHARDDADEAKANSRVNSKDIADMKGAVKATNTNVA